VDEEVEKLEADFLEKDLLQALQQEESAVATRNASGRAPHVHSASCGSGCGHQHHHHNNNNSHQHDHSHHHDQHPHSNEHQNHAPQDSSVKDLPPATTTGAAEQSKQHLLRAIKLFVQASAAGQAQVQNTFTCFPTSNAAFVLRIILLFCSMMVVYVISLISIVSCTHLWQSFPNLYD